MLKELEEVKLEVNSKQANGLDFNLDLPSCELCHRPLSERVLQQYLSPLLTPKETREIIDSKLPECCECRRKRDEEGNATFIHEEDGRAIHQSCADKIRRIKLMPCGHCHDREALKKQIYNKFGSLKPENLFKRARLSKLLLLRNHKACVS